MVSEQIMREAMTQAAIEAAKAAIIAVRDAECPTKMENQCTQCQEQVGKH